MVRERRLWRGLWVLCLSLLLGLTAACGGSNYAHRQFTKDETSYRVGELSGEWSRVDVSQNDLAWQHDNDGSLIQVNSRCEPSLDLPLRTLTQHLLIGFTERETLDERNLMLDGREALRTHARAKLDGVPREMLIHVLKKNECVYDFSYIAAPGESFDAHQSDYERFVKGFRTVN